MNADAQTQAFVSCVECLAGDVARLRRRLQGDDYGLHLVGRVAGHVETLDAMLQPSAAEVYRANRAFGADEESAVHEALADASERARRLRALLGEDEERCAA